MTSVDWRQLEAAFRDLPDPENSLHAVQRNRNQWDLAGGPNEDDVRKRLHADFETLAVKAGINIGVANQSYARDGWLSLVREEGLHCARYTKGAVIRNVRLASAEFCASLADFADLSEPAGIPGRDDALRRDRYPLRSWLYDHQHDCSADPEAELSYWTVHIWNGFRGLIGQYQAVVEENRRSSVPLWDQRGNRLGDAFIGLSYDLAVAHANHVLSRGLSNAETLSAFYGFEASLSQQVRSAWRDNCEALEISAEDGSEGGPDFALRFHRVGKDLEQLLLSTGNQQPSAVSHASGQLRSEVSCNSALIEVTAPQLTPDIALAGLPELSEAVKRRLATHWDDVLDKHNLTEAHAAEFDRNRNRLYPTRLSARSKQAAANLGLGPSVRIAEARLRRINSEYWSHWCSSGAPYQTYVTWVGILTHQVSAEVKSIWAGRSPATDHWFLDTCEPAIDRALSALVKPWISQARDVEMRRPDAATALVHPTPGHRTAKEAAMNDLHELPQPFQNAFEALKARAELDYANRGERFPQPQLSEHPIHHAKRIQDVFFGYCAQAREACRDGHWTAAEMRQRTEAAWPIICDYYFLREHGAISDQAKLTYRHSLWRTINDDPQWKKHLSELATLAEMNFAPGRDAALERVCEPATIAEEPSPKQGLAVVPVDTGAWERIEICFIDSEHVQVTTLGEVRRLSYAEMGFGDRRGMKVGDRGPNKAWGWLRQLAENRGTIDLPERQRAPAPKGPWDAGRQPKSTHDALIEDRAAAAKARGKLQVAMKDLRRSLSRYFRIDENPIVFEQTRYRAQFEIGRSPSYHR